ncbi:MAG: SLC13 family permease [Planctomycetota bacterium]
MDPHALIVLCLLGASLILFLTDSVRYDAVAIGVVLVLAATGTLSPARVAFQGFASPAVVLVASMYAFAAAVAKSGITERMGHHLIGDGSKGEAWLVVRVVVVAGLLSSVLSNAGVVATLIPVLAAVARRAKISTSRLLMPMAFGSLLGGMLTLIGTSKNIAVNGVLNEAGATPFGLFDFTAFGAVLLAVGALYFLWPGRRLLPTGVVATSLTERYHVPQFVTEVQVEPNSHLIGRQVTAVDDFARFGITLLGLVRDQAGRAVVEPSPYNRIQAKDVLVLQGEPDAIVALRNELGLHQSVTDSVNKHLDGEGVQLVEAVVPAWSRLNGRTPREADFRATTGLNVLAISKTDFVSPREIADTRLEVGDVLLIQGDPRDIARIRDERRLIVMGELAGDRNGRPGRTLALLGGVLLLALLGMDLAVAALGGALGLVLFGCVSPDDVRRGIDWSVLILIGGMLALGKAFDEHGLSAALAHGIHEAGGAVEHPHVLLLLLLGATLLLTQTINHVAAAVIMTPVALSLASELGLSDRPFLMAVLAGAEFAFMSPVAHQANAMVMGAGEYRYRHFLKAGTPLTVILVAVSTMLIPVFWPFVAA